MDRRTLLRAVGVGVTVGSAGCSGGGDGSGGDGGDGSSDGSSGGPGTATTTPTNTAKPTETASPTSTQTPESRYSTVGDDSALIEQGSLHFLTVSGLPVDGNWELMRPASEPTARAYRQKKFDMESEETLLRINLSLGYTQSVSEAKSNYSGFLNEHTAGNYENVRSLDIGVECDVLQSNTIGTTEKDGATWIVFRDANVAGTAAYVRVSKIEDDGTKMPTVDETAPVAVEQHRKIR